MKFEYKYSGWSASELLEDGFSKMASGYSCAECKSVTRFCDRTTFTPVCSDECFAKLCKRGVLGGVS